MYQAIYFDAGSTVLHTLPRRDRIRLSLLSLGLVVEDDRLKKAMDRAYGQVGPEMEDFRTMEQEVQVWERYYRALLEALATDEVADALVSQLQERAFYSHWTAVYPDVHGSLDLLRAMGYRLGLISNAPPSLPQVLDDIGLARHFDSMVVSGVVGVRKPDEAIYRIALHGLGVQAEEAVFVDDVVENIVAAQALGFTTFLIDRDGSQPGSEHTRVTGLGEVVTFAAGKRSSQGRG